MGAGDEDPPDEDHQHGVEGVADVPQPWKEPEKSTERLKLRKTDYPARTEHSLPQVLPGSGNVGHVFVQDVLLGADAVILDVLGPVQLPNIEVKSLQSTRRKSCQVRMV